MVQTAKESQNRIFTLNFLVETYGKSYTQLEEWIVQGNLAFLAEEIIYLEELLNYSPASVTYSELPTYEEEMERNIKIVERQTHRKCPN